MLVRDDHLVVRFFNISPQSHMHNIQVMLIPRIRQCGSLIISKALHSTDIVIGIWQNHFYFFFEKVCLLHLRYVSSPPFFIHHLG